MTGLLGNIFSYGDGIKRQIAALLADPAGTINLGVQRAKEDQQGLMNAQANAMPLPGQKSVLPDERQRAIAKALLSDYGANAGMSGATVYHGSPYAFDKFDLSKIGTGEGVQAQGRGLYLAENPRVSENYAREIPGSRPDVSLSTGQVFSACRRCCA